MDDCHVYLKWEGPEVKSQIFSEEFSCKMGPEPWSGLAPQVVANTIYIFKGSCNSRITAPPHRQESAEEAPASGPGPTRRRPQGRPWDPPRRAWGSVQGEGSPGAQSVAPASRPRLSGGIWMMDVFGWRKKRRFEERYGNNRREYV